MRDGLLKNRKATSHIEMAISFALFILFVFFLLFYLRPIRNQNIGDVLTDAIELGIKDNTEIQLIEVPLILNGVTSDCFQVTGPFLTFNPQNIFVRNSSFRIVDFTILAGLPGDLAIRYSGDGYYIYFANTSFDLSLNPPNNCPQLNLSQYHYGAPRTYNLYYNDTLYNFKREYETNYSNFKESLSFPSLADFIVNITDIARTKSIMSMNRPKPLRVEVTAKDIPIELLMQDGSTIKAIMNIQVW